MIVSITNRVVVSRPKPDPVTNKIPPNPKYIVKDFLVAQTKKLPAFKFATMRTYNGIVIEINEEDKEEFRDILNEAGFEHDIEDQA